MVRTDAHPAAAVLEDNSSPLVKRVFDDIKSALRVPLVHLVFHDLARYPDFLELAWRQLHPNVQTVYFEQQADFVRARAVEGAAGLGSPLPLDDDGARSTLKVFHYVNPKLLLAVAALRAAAGGQYPKLEELPRDAKAQIPTGVPADAATITLVNPDAEGPAQPILQEIRAVTGIPSVNSDYRALAQWPEYLVRAWTSLQAARAQDAHRSLEREIRLMAEQAVLVLPFRIEINPHVMRLCGLDEEEIDDVRATIERYYRALPGLVVNMAFLSVGAFGRADAARSPFPIDLSR